MIRREFAAVSLEGEAAFQRGSVHGWQGGAAGGLGEGVRGDGAGLLGRLEVCGLGSYE